MICHTVKQHSRPYPTECFIGTRLLLLSYINSIHETDKIRHVGSLVISTTEPRLTVKRSKRHDIRISVPEPNHWVSLRPNRVDLIRLPELQKPSSSPYLSLKKRWTKFCTFYYQNETFEIVLSIYPKHLYSFRNCLRIHSNWVKQYPGRIKEDLEPL